MTFTDRRERFRAHMAGDRCLVPASVFDPLSARLAEDLGFEMGMVGGSSASLAVLGAPDLIVLTLSELAGQCRCISRASRLPFMVDADHGYGNALNVMRTVEELEAAGVAALTIEDTALPQAFGQGGETRLLSLEEGAGKMRAAVAARGDPALVIVGRTSAARVTGLDDAIARARAYAEAGVDAVFLLGVETAAEVEAVAAAVSVPLVVEGKVWHAMSPQELAARSVKVCLRGHPTLTAAVQAMHATLKALREGVEPGDLEGLAPKALMDRVTRRGEYDGWIRDFMEPEDE
ncbi:MAG: isocitrate lyase/phosphoenolpyruvate mutase family protein [Myxococcota bacterium]|nr:isocitrate lyase/phosphoenolpyruvate mutase family protein [Myxococcota bacterium]